MPVLPVALIQLFLLLSVHVSGFEIGINDPYHIHLRWEKESNRAYSLAYAENGGPWMNLELADTGSLPGSLRFMRKDPCFVYRFVLGTWNESGLINEMELSAPVAEPVVIAPLKVNVLAENYLPETRQVQVLVSWGQDIPSLDEWTLEDVNIHSKLDLTKCLPDTAAVATRLISPTAAEVLFPEPYPELFSRGVPCKASFTIYRITTKCGYDVPLVPGIPDSLHSGSKDFLLRCDLIQGLPCQSPPGETAVVPPICMPQSMVFEKLAHADNQIAVTWRFTDTVITPERFFVQIYERNGNPNRLIASEDVFIPEITVPFDAFDAQKSYDVGVCAIFDTVTHMSDINWAQVPMKVFHPSTFSKSTKTKSNHMEASAEEKATKPDDLDHLKKDKKVIGSVRVISTDLYDHPVSEFSPPSILRERMPRFDWATFYNVLVLLFALSFMGIALVIFLMCRQKQRGRDKLGNPTNRAPTSHSNPVYNVSSTMKNLESTRYDSDDSYPSKDSV